MNDYDDENYLGEAPRTQANMITAVTKEQAALGTQMCNEWIARAKSTKPVDRDRFVQAITLAYSTVKLPAPRVIWFPSPLKALSTCVLEASKNKRALITVQLSVTAVQMATEALTLNQNVAPRVYGALVNLLQKKVEDVCLGIPHTIKSEIDVRASVIADSHPKLGEALRFFATGAVHESVFGALALNDYAHRVLGIRECWHLQGLVGASGASWYWPFTDLVIATERPTHIMLDDKGKPHNATSLAVCYADGFGAHARHGVWIPREAIAGTIDWKDVERITNTEMRDALVEMRAEKWSKERKKAGETEDERYDAAMAIKRLGGLEAVGDLLEEKKSGS